MWRDLILVVLAMLSGAGEQTAIAEPGCSGALMQGGLVVCEGAPGTVFEMGEVALVAGEDGRALFGLRRDAPARMGIIASPPGAPAREIALVLAERNDVYRELTGLDCDKVDARTPEQIAHAQRSWVLKQIAFATFSPGDGVGSGFILPSEGRPSSPFGPTRRYTGVSAETGEPCDSTSVHQGYDIAAPVGTPIIAPAPGRVILADSDLYYEGGTIFLDHGHGLVSVFMHMSEVDVAPGDEVAQGERLGAVGNTGRTTGPHLHWAVKWRNPASTERGGDFYIDPALLLDLPAATPAGYNGQAPG